jgi:L-lysine 2,3-aminomutase
MDPDICSFLTEYYSSVILALHANRCREAQVE